MRSLLILSLIGTVMAADGGDAAHPLNDLLAAVKGRSLAAWYAALPPERQKVIAGTEQGNGGLAVQPGQPGQQGQGALGGRQRGGFRLPMGLMRPFVGFEDAAKTAEAGVFLHGLISHLSEAADGSAAPLPAATTDGRPPDLQAIWQFMAARDLIGELAKRIVADGLESDQVQALRLWADACAEGLPITVTDAQAQEAGAHVIALRTALIGADMREFFRLSGPELLAKIDAALPELEQACAALGCDVAGSLAKATVTIDPGEGDLRTVVLHMPVNGVDVTLPLHMKQDAYGWWFSPDSPLVTWLGGGDMGFQTRGGPGGRQGVGPGGPGGPGGPAGGQGGRGPQGGEQGQDGGNTPAPTPGGAQGF